jgi:hypothetical protein
MKVFAAIPVAWALVASTTSQGQQFTNPAGAGWWHTSVAGTNPPLTRGVAIGNVGAGPYPSAFQVRGELLPAANQTPEVFRTTAPTTGLTSWRMFQGGTTAGFERGQLFADPANTNFNINAPNGGFLLLTQNVQRARLNGNVLGPIGLFPAINRDGFLMLSGQPNAFVNGGSNAPFTRLHLIDGVGPADPITYAQTIGFRPWQRNGITFTGNSDQSYIGHRYAGDDNTDFVIQWSDNPNGSPWGTDRMRFVFTTQFVPGATRGATSVEGLEAIRLWPQSSQLVNVGIGDFFAGNQITPTLVQDPTERLDILNGRLRIRELPDNDAAIDSFYVMVVDRTTLTENNQERGVVKWVDPSIFSGGGNGSADDCRWTLQSAGVSGPTVSHNLTTAVGVSNDCPDQQDLVGIGTATPLAKLDVVHDNTNYGPNFAGHFQMQGQSTVKTALQVELSGTGGTHIGLQARSDDASYWNRGAILHGRLRSGSGVTNTFNVGAELIAQVETGNTSIENYGAYARAVAAAGTTGTCFGVYGAASGATTNWAGYFSGDVKVVGDLHVTGAYNPSDAALKTGVEDVEPAIASEVLDLLSVHSYHYNTEAFPQLALPNGPQLGFLAQELEGQLPGLVKTTTHPAERDEDGNVIRDAVSYKAVNYTALIPYLVAGYQAQRSANDALAAQLAEQRARMDHLEQALAACCAHPGGADGRMQVGMGEVIEGDARRLLIQPNPFNEQTTLSYTLERSGRAQLLVNSADGKQLKALHEAVQEAGQYQYTWNTGDLVPGVYYVTLLLDGEPLVKKAVKVSR